MDIFGSWFWCCTLYCCHQSTGFTGNEYPDVSVQLSAKIEAGAKNVFTQESICLCLSQGSSDNIDSYGAIVAQVNESVMRAYSIGANYQSFQHAMWVAQKESPIHKSAGFAFVSIDDDILCLARCVAGGFPLSAGREATTPSAS